MCMVVSDPRWGSIGKTTEIAMHRFFVQTFRFDLDREMVDPESTADECADRMKNFFVTMEMFLIHGDVTCEHYQTGLHGPNMEIVHVANSVERFDGLRQFRKIHARGCRFEQHIERFSEKRPCAFDDHDHDDHADQRIQNSPAGEENADAASGDAEGNPRVSEHVPKGSADVQIVLRAPLKQQGDAEIGNEADKCDADDPGAGDGNGIEDPLDSHERQNGRRDQENKAVQKGGDDPCAVITVGAGLGSRTRGQHVGPQGQQQSALVDQIVTSIAHQSEAVGQIAADKFQDNDDGVEYQAPNQAGSQLLVAGGHGWHTGSLALPLARIKRPSPR